MLPHTLSATITANSSASLWSLIRNSQAYVPHEGRPQADVPHEMLPCIKQQWQLTVAWEPTYQLAACTALQWSRTTCSISDTGAACHGRMQIYMAPTVQHAMAVFPNIYLQTRPFRLMQLFKESFFLSRLPHCHRVLMGFGGWRVCVGCCNGSSSEANCRLNNRAPINRLVRVTYIDIYPWSTDQCVSHITCTGLT